MKTDNGHRIGTMAIFGIGKNFRIINHTFFTEIRYTYDINNWQYPTYNDPISNYIDIKRKYVLLNLGITF